MRSTSPVGKKDRLQATIYEGRSSSSYRAVAERSLNTCEAKKDETLPPFREEVSSPKRECPPEIQVHLNKEMV
jgi:hypothetical protein